MWVQFLNGEDPLEKEMVTHFSTLAWEIPWMEESGGLQSMELESDMTDRLNYHNYLHYFLHLHYSTLVIYSYTIVCKLSFNAESSLLHSTVCFPSQYLPSLSTSHLDTCAQSQALSALAIMKHQREQV